MVEQLASKLLTWSRRLWDFECYDSIIVFIIKNLSEVYVTPAADSSDILNPNVHFNIALTHAVLPTSKRPEVYLRRYTNVKL